MEQTKLSVFKNALKNDERESGKPFPKGNPSYSARSISSRTYVEPRISDPKIVKSMGQLPTGAKDTKFFVGGVPPKMYRTALQGLFENAVIKCGLP
jgi:hypothetical protein